MQLQNSRIIKILRRSDEYTTQEFLAAVYEFSAKEDWPEKTLSQILTGFVDADREKLKSAAELLLAEMPPNQVGYQHGYATTEEGDFERMTSSPTIPREFVEALSLI